ncbi:MAG: hypothetical protein KGN31_01670 [Betaproteobacteria bacterium]|nr:hypothetical protein [Betaproteobacteria bacterium]MDE2422901.1 hypothetical protein [Betaproteobacteria bacterium]
MAEPSCPDEDCDCHGLDVSAGKPFKSTFGSTMAASPRWKYMTFSKTFSAAKSSTLRQRKSQKNKRLFEMLAIFWGLLQLPNRG